MNLARLFRPKHSVESVAKVLAGGLEDGTIVLRATPAPADPVNTQAALRPTAAANGSANVPAHVTAVSPPARS